MYQKNIVEFVEKLSPSSTSRVSPVSLLVKFKKFANKKH